MAARAFPSDVAERLSATTGVQKLPNRKLDLFFVRDFLSDEDCAALCDLIDRNRRPSEIANDMGDAAFRTSETCDLDAGEPVVQRVETLLTMLTGIPGCFGEAIQGQRYAPGQEFKAHTDTFTPGTPDFYHHCAEQGQRTWTAMLYLNEPEAGGATRFKVINKTVQPETGKLLLWNNLLPDGNENHATLHHGMKVRSGTKYIITKWYRQHEA
ncbi:prolyl hydroxylase family protein [Sphingomicrobium clamense]|uniref:2OG-Fe(II) oxygenase n=1 Tax=Sphingomicrobium clamense TaxID=2851013 RepID=A0ABS6V366_9SPHN|nr:2OG-Fe(II) oxygenase [Sphingomicrobium sp. B8]MBW0143989.1 2OG-Fe(II) oxygenase [Sphingomicrobium sp. B8]